MAKLFVKFKSVFSRGPKNEEQSSPPASDTTTSSPSISRQHSETEAPAYYHAAAAQPPAYQTLPSQPLAPESGRPSDAPRTTFQQQAREIAKIQVGGMRRTVGGGGASSFTASYAPVQPTGPPAGTFKSSTGGQAVNAPVTGEKSSFRGNSDRAAHGRPQQETAEDDEDIWARLAM